MPAVPTPLFNGGRDIGHQRMSPSIPFSRLAAAGEIVVFAALGDGFAGAVWVDGLILVAVLALFARPFTVLLLAPTLLRNEKLFVFVQGTWVPALAKRLRLGSA